MNEEERVPPYSELPEHLRDGVRGYIEDRRPVGGFLTSVFENDLGAAAERADGVNRPRLAEIAQWVRWYAPTYCYGSRSRVETWLTQGKRERHRAIRENHER